MNYSQKLSQLVTFSELLNWAKSHRRDRIFSKDEPIPTRPGLLYLVASGTVRLMGLSDIKISNKHQFIGVSQSLNEPVFLGLIGSGQPFEMVAQFPFSLQAYAHGEETLVIWLYWQELEDNWSDLKLIILESFRYQHQRKLLWLSILGQKRTIDRLLGLLKLLSEESGEITEMGCCLPYALTHAQIGSAIGATRVTVTRLMGKLREEGIITIQGENLICLK